MRIEYNNKGKDLHTIRMQKELYQAKDNLKIGDIVEIRINFGEEEDGSKGKKMNGIVLKKYTHHFLVQINTPRGNSWNESFMYKDLLQGKVKAV